jgi:hypothetical protein
VRGPGWNRPPQVRSPRYRPPHRRWYGHRPSYRYGWGTGVYLYPPGVYGTECRLVKRRVRVLTDTGWHLRWRYRRVCY